MVFLSPMCTQRPISSCANSGVAWISTPLPMNTIPRVMMWGLASLNFSSRQYRTKYQGVYARLRSTHRSEANVRNLACRGSRRFDPRQRRWIGAPHMLVMAGKPIAHRQHAKEVGERPVDRSPARVTLTCTRSLLMPNRRGRIWETEVLARTL